LVYDPGADTYAMRLTFSDSANEIKMEPEYRDGIMKLLKGYADLFEVKLPQMYMALVESASFDFIATMRFSRQGANISIQDPNIVEESDVEIGYLKKREGVSVDPKHSMVSFKEGD